MTTPPEDTYDAAAGYYDLFAAAQGTTVLPSLKFFAALVQPDQQVLDVGAGTGRIALAVAAKAGHVYCLEPSRAMRAVLLSKLAQRPSLRARLTVLPGGAPSFCLPARIHYAYLAGVLQYVSASDRPALFGTLAAHLHPGATLAMDMIGGQPGAGWPQRLLQEAVAGHCRYTLQCSAEPDGPSCLRMQLIYRTRLHGHVIAEDRAERIRHFHSPSETQADLLSAGFLIAGGSVAEPYRDDEPAAPDGGTLVAVLAAAT